MKKDYTGICVAPLVAVMLTLSLMKTNLISNARCVTVSI